VHDKADFDHSLFLQHPPNQNRPLMEWRESPQPAKFFMKADLSQSVIDPDSHVLRRTIVGMQKNVDTWV